MDVPVVRMLTAEETEVAERQYRAMWAAEQAMTQEEYARYVHDEQYAAAIEDLMCPVCGDLEGKGAACSSWCEFVMDAGA